MKKALLFFVIAIIFFSCRKEKVNPDEIRILKTSQNGPNGSKVNINFNYDAQGRIAGITRNNDNELPKLVATVTYNGNEVTIVDTFENSASSKIAKTIKFVLDGERKPLQRIQVETNYFLDAAYEQKSFIYDTTYYDYNAAGLLVQTREYYADSLWFFQPSSGVVTHSDLRNMTRNFQYNNNNVSVITGRGTRLYRQTSGSNTSVKNYNREEAFSFDYTNGFSNTTDFKNAFVLAEYGGNSFFTVLNARAGNIPNKRVYTYNEKDSSTGAEVFANSDIANYKVFYNGYGFLSGFTTQNGNNPDVVLTYNR
ncbi:hypothetical protein ESA94_20645 [Lacibacter luteus]|uniref:DUF4595 domain-containing protein n=1 Tax=Lacibacter luteus TaxID=2508719 RepID=A0A4Q1CDP6_9BACT|nr:hypothetical protein [Lacibacter luteus]RXK57609.1 hypothetical protein ESA94_20645 [Lacibacter luteus]